MGARFNFAYDVYPKVGFALKPPAALPNLFKPGRTGILFPRYSENKLEFEFSPVIGTFEKLLGGLLYNVDEAEGVAYKFIFRLPLIDLRVFDVCLVTFPMLL